MAPSHRKKTVGKRTTTESSPPGDRKIKRRKRGTTHPGFNIGASSSSAFERPGSKLRPEPESIILGQRRSYPRTYNVGHMSHTCPCLELPMRKARTPLIFQQKDNAIEIPVVKFNARKTRPTRAWRPRPPAATTWAARPDPMVTPMVQNVLPHRDPMVTPMVRNVHSHLAVQQAGETSQTSHPLAPSAKGWTTCSPRLLLSYHSLRAPRGFLVPKFSTYDGSSDPFDHIMHYRQLMTLDIGNDALCAKYSRQLQGQALSWFHRLPPNSVDNFRDLSEAFVGQYLCSARHKQNISTLQNIKMR
ncbi:hypothetical protein CK203_105104 [Vitis vinifera]|uniref:Retrotransposon gag domain-containing protein n=1 Tax=Vitis vinifera TaxID=29760 RepID=A0A438CNW7_VITVI|nr:hypothetical protein CK203_105104 [Vitis vinifera]